MFERWAGRRFDGIGNSGGYVRVRATDVFGIIVKVRCGKDSETTGPSRVDRDHCARETSPAGPAFLSDCRC